MSFYRIRKNLLTVLMRDTRSMLIQLRAYSISCLNSFRNNLISFKFAQRQMMIISLVKAKIKSFSKPIKHQRLTIIIEIVVSTLVISLIIIHYFIFTLFFPFPFLSDYIFYNLDNKIYQRNKIELMILSMKKVIISNFRKTAASCNFT